MNCRVAVDLTRELNSRESNATRSKRRPLSFRYWAWYALPLAMLVAVLVVPATSDLDPRDVATAMLGGQIGFLGFLFAIVTFVADTGVLSGTRGVRRLTESTLPYFVVVLVSTGATALCVINPNEMYARTIVCAALVIAMLLPVVVIRLGRRAAPDFVASQIRRELVPLFERRDTDLFRDVIHEDLNDLRAAAILLWNRGDLEGYKTLVNAFLESIPGQDGDIEFPQFRFLSMWIEMQSEQPAGLLFMADQATDEILVRLHDGHFNVAARLLRFVTDTVAHVLASPAHAEYRMHALRVVEIVAHKVDHIGQIPPLRVRGCFTELRAIVESFVRNEVGEQRAATNTQAHETLFSLVLLIGSWPCDTAGCDHRTCGSEKRILPSEVVQAMVRDKLMLSRHMVERIRDDVFINENVRSSDDRRIRLLGALVPGINLLRLNGDVQSARRLLEVVTSGLPVDRIDTGSARYLNKCLEALQKHVDGDPFWQDVVLCRTAYIVASNKDKDIREHMTDLLRLGAMPGVDHVAIGRSVQDCIVAVMQLKGVSPRKRMETLRLLVGSRSPEFPRRAELRLQLLGILERLSRSEGAPVAGVVHDDVRMVSDLLIGLLWAEESNGAKVRDPALGVIAARLTDTINGDNPPDLAVIQEVLFLGEKLSSELTALGARVNALKFVHMSLAAAKKLDSVEQRHAPRGDKHSRTVNRLLTCARRALELPRTTIPPDQHGVALDAVEDVVANGGTIEESLWCSVLAAQWIRRTIGRRKPDPLDRQRLTGLIADLGQRCTSTGERALFLGAQKSVALLLSGSVEDRGEQFEKFSKDLGKLLDDFDDENFELADRRGILDAYRMVAVSEREHDRYLAAARTGGRSLSVATKYLEGNLDSFLLSADKDERDRLIGIISRNVEGLVQDLVRVDPLGHLTSGGAPGSPVESAVSAESSIDSGRFAQLKTAVKGLKDFLRCLDAIVTHIPEKSDEKEGLWDLRVRLATLTGKVFVTADVLYRMLADAFPEGNGGSLRSLEGLRRDLRALISYMDALCGNRRADPPWARDSQVVFPLEVSIAAATDRYVATMRTSTFPQLPKNMKSYLEERGKPSLEPYIVSLLQGSGSDVHRSQRLSRLDDQQRRHVIRSIDVMTDAVLDDLTDDGTGERLSVAEQDQVTALWHCENSLRIRQILGVQDRYVHYGVTYMLLVAERLGDDRLPKHAPELIFGDIDRGRSSDWSVFAQVLLSENNGPDGSGAAGSVQFRNAASRLVLSLLGDPSRRHVSSRVRVRLEELWTRAPRGSGIRSLLEELLRLWNPYFAEFPEGGGERLLSVDAPDAGWMSLAPRDW